MKKDIMMKCATCLCPLKKPSFFLKKNIDGLKKVLTKSIGDQSPPAIGGGLGGDIFNNTRNALPAANTSSYDAIFFIQTFHIVYQLYR
jgi:hypothetical protein